MLSLEESHQKSRKINEHQGKSMKIDENQRKINENQQKSTKINENQ